MNESQNHMILTHQDVALSMPLPYDTFYEIPYDPNSRDLDECPVCLEVLHIKHPNSVSYIERLNCGHYFCKSCVKMLESSSDQLGCFSCPCCRQIQHRSKNILVRAPLLCYYRFRHEIAVFISIMCWMLAMTILIMVIYVNQTTPRV